jgi:hypothetical protein
MSETMSREEKCVYLKSMKNILIYQFDSLKAQFLMVSLSGLKQSFEKTLNVNYLV